MNKLQKWNGRIAILYGGISPEREISLQSGECVFQALNQMHINAYLMDVHSDLNLYQELSNDRPDMVFIALHGSDGENGVVQAILEYLKMPYTGSGVLASALAMDKYRFKLCCQALGLHTPKCYLLKAGLEKQDISLICDDFFPAVVKPINFGSSIGVKIVHNNDQVMLAYEELSTYNCDLLVEQFIPGKEYTVGILGDTVLPAINIVPFNDFYSYHAKYLTKATQFLIPSGLLSTEEKHLKSLALQAFNAINCVGFGRVDFIRDPQGIFWLLELNTIPGLTTHSLLPKAARELGLNFNQLVAGILSTVPLNNNPFTI